jgi:glycerophosphoryl diester phosphodiesterase
MVGFQGAVQVGADAIETDLHLSRDGVVVLSHVSDPLKVEMNFSCPTPLRDSHVTGNCYCSYLLHFA